MPRVNRATFWTLVLLALLGGTELVAQIVWAYLERQAMEAVVVAGEKALRNDAINFLKEPHPVYGYRLKPGLDLPHLKTTVQGFPQRQPVGVERRPGSLRLVAMGESTTMGHNVDTGNYPAHLRRLLAERTGNSRDEAEVINAGVAGWVSGQIALLAERELKDYRPDIVFLYVGWNDFQSYDPLGPPPEKSYFDQHYKSVLDSPLANVPRLKSLVLLYALSARVSRLFERVVIVESPGSPADPGATYRFLINNLDRMVAAFRAENPGVAVMVATLAGRWPNESRDLFESRQGRIWWMRKHGLDREDAAAMLARLNAVLRDYAVSRGLVLVDLAAAYEPLNRPRLMRDFAHMHDEGYELMAEIIFDHLRRQGLVEGMESPRLAALRKKYWDRPASNR